MFLKTLIFHLKFAEMSAPGTWPGGDLQHAKQSVSYPETLASNVSSNVRNPVRGA